ncbi:hypothetical protein PsYK624_128430 [Phanerochaete sordida]|uniref:Uncharacterized protein n=1 Tax=Phanerochaete sordida TaxID=48140 RepID=A0A9P3LIY0_9APHY|nr:hypothetical protein PsYK624_128430 [Phanerochaete sordida]
MPEFARFSALSTAIPPTVPSSAGATHHASLPTPAPGELSSFLTLDDASVSGMHIPAPDAAEQRRLSALARLLDEVPRMRPWLRRARTRRRRAVDGGAEMNGSGPWRGASPAPTTVSTNADTLSVGESMLPPAYARYSAPEE